MNKMTIIPLVYFLSQDFFPFARLLPPCSPPLPWQIRHRPMPHGPVSLRPAPPQAPALTSVPCALRAAADPLLHYRGRLLPPRRAGRQCSPTPPSPASSRFPVVSKLVLRMCLPWRPSPGGYAPRWAAPRQPHTPVAVPPAGCSARASRAHIPERGHIQSFRFIGAHLCQIELR
jgi:hypothetical protein